MRRRHALLIAVPACAALLGSAPAAKASRPGLIPAPPAQASGVAAQVGSLLDVSRTGAAADSGTSSAEASVVRLGGEPLLDLGGSQQGDGQTGGSLIDTGDTLPARAQVAPWEAAAQGSQSSTRQARSAAAVARADVPDVASAGVLTSESEASHTDEKSNGRSVTDGVQLGILDAVRVVLLHSEVSSDGKGDSYLVDLNGTKLGTDEQLGNSPLCALNAPGLLGLSCLTASGGEGSANGIGSAAAQVAEVTAALDVLGGLNPVAAFTAAATSGAGQTVAAPAPEPVNTLGAETGRATTPAAAEASTATGSGDVAGTLARTGAAAASLAAVAAALMLAGLMLRRFRLRPTTN
ncbi:MAG TPA: hypothetical protein VEG38_15105 [Acidimicrobiia bacterium]|nr:hypothetical protein [Acidimicrobiia bacterium]